MSMLRLSGTIRQAQTQHFLLISLATWHPLSSLPVQLKILFSNAVIIPIGKTLYLYHTLPELIDTSRRLLYP